MSDSLLSLLIAVGDDELILGHRHSEWTGWAPHIEEDVAFSSIAQDEIGHATNYYALGGTITGKDPDAIALGRDKGEYRHAVLCERPNRDWAWTLARHWLYDHADDIRLQALADAAHDELAALATKIRREERYHLLHADAWMTRVAHGPVEARAKVIDALGEAFPGSLALFEPIELEDDAVKQGWLPTPSDELRERFVARTVAALDELGMPSEIHARLDDSAEFVASSSGDLIAREGDETSPTESRDSFGGRAGRHSPDFDELWAMMTETYRSEPGATW